MALKLAIYGYDSDIGKLVIETLEEQKIQLDDVFPLSPFSGEYDAVNICSQNYFVQPIEEFDFEKANVVLFLSTQDESQRWISKAQNAGCIVVDNSHLFSGDEKTALVVPEINPFDIKKAIESRLVIPALAPSVQICLALGALHDEFGVTRAVATAMESVSESGRLGTETLAHETTLLLNGMNGDHQGFSAQVAFNLHTISGSVEDNGYTDHEQTIKSEVSRILGKFERGFDVTTVQVPVFYGHTISVNADLEESVNVEDVIEAFKKSQFVTVKDNDENLTPVEDVINERTVLVSRIRQNIKGSKNVSFVCLMDNTRRGEAISCVEIVKLVAQNI